MRGVLSTRRQLSKVFEQFPYLIAVYSTPDFDFHDEVQKFVLLSYIPLDNVRALEMLRIIYGDNVEMIPVLNERQVPILISNKIWKDGEWLV